jgi:hypothetical protein
MKKKRKRENLFDKISNTIFLEQHNSKKSQTVGEQEEGEQTKAFSPHNFHRRVSKPSRYQEHLKDDLDMICQNQEETKILIQQPYFYIENANLNQTKDKSKLDYLMLANYDTAQWKEILEDALKSTPEDTAITTGECIITRDMKEKGNYKYYVHFESESETLLKNRILKDREKPQERTTTDNMEKGINNGKGMFKDFSLEVGMAESAKEWQKASKGKSEEIRRELLLNQIKEIGTLFRTERGKIKKDELPAAIEDMDRYYAIINKALDLGGYKNIQIYQLKKQKKLAEEELEQYRRVLEFEDKVSKKHTEWEVLKKLGDGYEKDVKPFNMIWTSFKKTLATLGEKE